MRNLSLTLLCVATAITAGAVKPVEEPIQLHNGGNAQLAMPQAQRVNRAVSMRADEQATTFVEGFEAAEYGTGYEGLFWNWLPEGWQDVSRQGNSYSSNDALDYTWRVMKYNGLYGPHTGTYFAYCRPDQWVADGIQPLDEWLMTPKAYVSEGYVFHFYLCYSPGWQESPTPEGRTQCILEVNVSADGGETWTPVWNTRDDAASFTDEELAADKALSDRSSNFRHIFIDLDEYAGKELTFAFRYYGDYGQPVAIDDVALGVPKPNAGYVFNVNTFMQTLTANLATPGKPMLLAPADTELSWQNVSTDSRTYEWTYIDASGTATTTDEHLTTPGHPFGTEVAAPILNSGFGANVATFQTPYSTIRYGGEIGTVEASSEEEGTINDLCGVGTYDWIAADRIRYNSLVGFNLSTCDSWGRLLQENAPTDYYYAHSLSTYYDTPLAPYGIKQVFISAYIKEISPSREVTMKIYTCEDDPWYAGSMIISDEPVATATITGLEANPYAYQPLVFDFTKYGLTVKTAILVELEGFDGEKDDVTFPFIISEGTHAGTSYMGLLLPDSNGGTYIQRYHLASLPSGLWGGGNSHVAGVLMGLDASYSFMNVAEGATTVDLPGEGGEFTLKVNAFHKPEAWTVTIDGSPVDWITFDAEAPAVEGDPYTVTVKVEANEGKARTTAARLASPGSGINLKIKQPAYSGISSIVTTTDAAPVYFNLQGLKVNQPVKGGIYIKRTGSKAEKVIF